MEKLEEADQRVLCDKRVPTKAKGMPHTAQSLAVQSKMSSSKMKMKKKKNDNPNIFYP